MENQKCPVCRGKTVEVKEVREIDGEEVNVYACTLELCKWNNK